MTLADLLADARGKPGRLSDGHAGVCTAAHLAGEMFRHFSKTDIVGVPYRGGAAALNDLLSGQIQIFFNNAIEALPHLQSGSIRALGVSTAARAAFQPNVPTIAEAGVPGYATEVWWALLGPGGLPAEIAETINRDCAAALRAPVRLQRLEQFGAMVAGGSSGDLTN